MRKSLIVIVAVLCIVSFAAAAAADDSDVQYAQVSTQSGPLNMRKSASKNASVVEKIPKDTILPVTPVDDVWCRCAYNGKDGYVMAKYLTYMDASQFAALSPDDTGPAVRALKEKLQALHYLDADLEIDDCYDADTAAAVKLLQAAQGMEETGVASAQLQALLNWGSPKNNLPTKRMTVQIKSSCSGYNHVGSNWSRYCSIDGSAVSSGDTVEIVLGESIMVYSKVTESDKSPDIGTKKETVEITQDYYDNGFTVTHEISVKEDKGRYAGNKAHWTVTYTFVP